MTEIQTLVLDLGQVLTEFWVRLFENATTKPWWLTGGEQQASVVEKLRNSTLLGENARWTELSNKLYL